MTTITPDQLYHKIKHGGYRFAKVYDGFFANVPANRAYFQDFKCESADELVAFLEEFTQMYQGVFTIILRSSAGASNTGTCIVRINLSGHVQQMQGNQQQQVVGANESPEQMKSRILEEIKAEMKLTMLEATIKQKDAEIMEMKTTSGKLGMIFENFLMARSGKAAPLFQNQQLQGTVNVENDETEVTDEELGEALITIKDKFGIKTLMVVAEKIKNNDPQIDMLINMFNNG